MTKLVIVGAAMLGSLVAGCSAVLNWNAEGLPCGPGKTCADTYSCLIDRCISNKSLSEGETCTFDQQCAEGAVCPPGMFVCRKSCGTDFFTPGSYCSAETYCLPVEVPDDVVCTSGLQCAAGQWCADTTDNVKRCYYFQGVCIDKDACTPPATQGAAEGCPKIGQVCVPLSSTAKACLPGCQITWQGGPTYSDNCGSASFDRKYCQPLGVKDSQRLVCLDSQDPGQPTGQLCDQITSPCSDGDACINKKCLRHCPVGNDLFCANAKDKAGASINAPLCCDMNNAKAGDSYGVCHPTCAGL